MIVTIEGIHMPGRACAPPDAGGQRYENVHVGVQRGKEAVDLVPGDTGAPIWSFEVEVRPLADGLDFAGPYVHGRKGERFLYLSWGEVGDDGFSMFRRAKLCFADAGPDVLASAAVTGLLGCRVTMTDGLGNPRCARVRDAVWSEG